MIDINELVKSEEALAVVDGGAWVGDLDGAEGLELFVLGLSSLDAQKELEKGQAAARSKNKGKPLNDLQLSKIMQKVLAEAVLKNWRGLSSGGDPVEYSKELATKFLTSRGSDKFAMAVLQAAKRVDSESQSFAEAALKN